MLPAAILDLQKECITNHQMDLYNTTNLHDSIVQISFLGIVVFIRFYGTFNVQRAAHAFSGTNALGTMEKNYPNAAPVSHCMLTLKARVYLNTNLYL